MADGKLRNRYDRNGAGLLVEHPFGNLVGAAMSLTNQEIANTVMHEVSDDHDTLTDQRVERIFDLRFECQKPGTMIPAPRSELKTGRCSPPSSRRAVEQRRSRRLHHPNAASEAPECSKHAAEDVMATLLQLRKALFR